VKVYMLAQIRAMTTKKECLNQYLRQKWKKEQGFCSMV